MDWMMGKSTGNHVFVFTIKYNKNHESTGEDHHLLLVTLLLFNTVANEADRFRSDCVLVVV